MKHIISRGETFHRSTQKHRKQAELDKAIQLARTAIRLALSASAHDPDVSDEQLHEIAAQLIDERDRRTIEVVIAERQQRRTVSVNSSPSFVRFGTAAAAIETGDPIIITPSSPAIVRLGAMAASIIATANKISRLPPKPDDDKLRALFEKGYTYPEIADQMSVSISTVKRDLSRLGLHRKGEVSRS